MVDASVAVKWCLPNENELLVPEAYALLDAYRRSEMQLVVPDLFWPEIGNALWKNVWKGRIDAAWAQKAYAELMNLEIPTAPTYDLVAKASDLAIEMGPTIYDSLYVALAVESRIELITADERLANALAARFPVKWLGAF